MEQHLMEAWHVALAPPTAKEVWAAVDAARQAVAQIYWPVLRSKSEEVGFEAWDLLITRRALALEGGVTFAYLAALMPYGRPAQITEHLAGTAERGFIHGSAENGYWPTEKGREAATAVQVAEKLAFRGYDEAAYTEALQACCLRGLLQNDNGTYQVTEAGQKLRQEAEQATDRIFYAPWDNLYAPEMMTLKSNLEWLIATLSHAQSSKAL